jgi:phosphatidylglycerophosphate synthase
MAGGLLAGASFSVLAWVSDPWLCSAAAIGSILGMQFRLLCNLFDGMVALAGGRTPAPTGELWNDLPDRISDACILIGAGIALTHLPWGRDLGWFAALLAVMTAYIRQLGRAQGAASCFAGPMAKQHRMAVMTVAALCEAVAVHWGCHGWSLYAGLIVVCVGSAVTCLRRLSLVAGMLRGRGP